MSILLVKPETSSPQVMVDNPPAKKSLIRGKILFNQGCLIKCCFCPKNVFRISSHAFRLSTLQLIRVEYLVYLFTLFFLLKKQSCFFRFSLSVNACGDW